MARNLSCAVLLMNEHAQLLLCHVTGKRWWDLPKGLQEPGETPRETALRELAEETGLLLAPGELLDLGRFPYRPDKDLHFFAALRDSDALDLSRCLCSSHFDDPRTGRPCPEVDAFEWVPFAQVGARCAKTMGQMLSGVVDLAQVLRRLRPSRSSA
jgi:8-oxo-dGTP pyrophosphatase MutT (NUDIX family)